MKKIQLTQLVDSVDGEDYGLHTYEAYRSWMIEQYGERILSDEDQYESFKNNYPVIHEKIQQHQELTLTELDRIAYAVGLEPTCVLIYLTDKDFI